MKTLDVHLHIKNKPVFQRVHRIAPRQMSQNKKQQISIAMPLQLRCKTIAPIASESYNISTSKRPHKWKFLPMLCK
ncbi:hypothetical protein L596_000199 [Steinernema carpocapsae]|uniref:Uncharacterized protein n=1 Tax=Steinernema carpocapsae TaxID=34508 RepID=A0A4U8UJL7_STECR|nr:hypothetical protein L596_000199 [Steinernema carpocapsae]